MGNSARQVLGPSKSLWLEQKEKAARRSGRNHAALLLVLLVPSVIVPRY